MTGMTDELRPPLTKRLRRWHWVVIDMVFGAMYVVAAVGGGSPVRSDLWSALVLGTVLAATTRRLWPLPALAVVQAGACAMAVFGTAMVGVLPQVCAMYTVALRLSRLRSPAALAAVLITNALSIYVGGTPTGTPANTRVLIVSSLIAAAWAVGYAVRQQRAYAQAMHDQAERRAEERARAQVAEERLRIARELHDVVAHSMSLIAVQAGVANFVLAARPGEGARVLSSIEQSARDALRETRRLLGLLRDDEGTPLAPELGPAPGLGDLDELIARTKDAGVLVDLEVRGPRRPLPAGMDLAAYRIIQEALTNVVKHSAARTGRVQVAYEDDGVRIKVTDDGGGGGAGGPEPTGHGIIGMRERAGLYGGEFHAGPLAAGGFEVAVRLPLEDGR
ncbi:MAG TPA: sensor histidine kinase [Streptosporangiaceae bacterium]|nr:sensor histidine kinase [Streptosporangiaceae bacterium]